jgi:SHS2 domain-containing protein
MDLDVAARIFRSTINTRRVESICLSYKNLEHATDAFIEVRAANLEEAFMVAAKSVIETIIDMDAVEIKQQRDLVVTGKDLRYLLYNWLEELIILTITEGFATGAIALKIEKGLEYKIAASMKGEPIDFKKHHFKVEIKSPTFHAMEISQDGGITMRYLLDL